MPQPESAAAFRCFLLLVLTALAGEDIERYLATGEPWDKAGAYAYQGRAAAFIERIEGSASGIVGLPLYETARLLSVFGYPLFP